MTEPASSRMSTHDNPFETPSPRGTQVVQATLRVVLALQCWGYAALRLHHHQGYAFSDLIVQGYKLSPDLLPQINDGTAYILIGCGTLMLFRPTWILLVPLVAWQAGMCVAEVLNAQSLDSQLAPALHATRYVAPLALLLVDFWPPRIKPTLAFCLSTVSLLRIATAATFGAYGGLFLYQAHQGGQNVELLTTLIQKLFHYELAAEHAHQTLSVLGALQIALALSLITSRNRLIAACMVASGLLTAFSSTIVYQFDGYDQTLMQISMAGAPLAVLLFWITAVKEQKPIILPDLDD